MTKPQSEAMAELHESELDRLKITRTPSYHYLAGFKAAVEQGEKMEFKAHYSLGDCSPCVLIADLKALLEPK